jgi:xanthine dehydrogenase accessory factor
MNDDFFSKADALTRAGIPFAIALVVRAEKPSSGKPGDKAIITADGAMHGWIGGSCAQPTVIREALKALRTDVSRFIRLSPDPLGQPPRAGLEDVPMTCFSGGTLEIYIEPQPPQPRLLIVGNLPVARALAELGKAMNYRTIIVEPGYQGEAPPYADELLTDLTALPGRVTPLTSIIVATHGQYDELALEQALGTNAPYIGLVASRTRAEAVRTYLAQQGIGAEQAARLKAPAGLDIGARRGDEIALSIMAEIVQRRRSGADLEWLPAPVADIQAVPTTAVDPVCGMSVTIAGAKFTYEYQGNTYYFCCPGCKASFRETPETYLASAAHSTPA